jgi:hypothetical protein
MPRGTLFSPSNGGPSADAPGGPRAMPQGETLPACRRGQSRQRRWCLRGVPLGISSMQRLNRLRMRTSEDTKEQQQADANTVEPECQTAGDGRPARRGLRGPAGLGQRV